MNSNTNLLISRHLALITHDATMSVNYSIQTFTMTNTIFFGLIENKKTFLLWEVHLPIKYSTMMGEFYHYNDLHCNVTGISTGLAVFSEFQKV